MTTVAILPTSDANGDRIYQAITGDKRSIGKTAGEALDALTAQIGSDEFSTLMVIQNFRPDWFFGVEQQQRLSELMTLWRSVRDCGQTLPLEQQAELDSLVDAELRAATVRSAALIQQISQ